MLEETDRKDDSKQRQRYFSEDCQALQIIWEDSFLKKNLKKLNKAHLNEFLKSVLQKTEAFLRKFVQTENQTEDIVVPESFDECQTGHEHINLPHTHFTRQITVHAHLLIFVMVVNQPNNQHLANGYACTLNQKGNTLIGVLNINVGRISST